MEAPSETEAEGEMQEPRRSTKSTAQSNRGGVRPASKRPRAGRKFTSISEWRTSQAALRQQQEQQQEHEQQLLQHQQWKQQQQPQRPRPQQRRQRQRQQQHAEQESNSVSSTDSVAQDRAPVPESDTEEQINDSDSDSDSDGDQDAQLVKELIASQRRRASESVSDTEEQVSDSGGASEDDQHAQLVKELIASQRRGASHDAEAGTVSDTTAQHDVQRVRDLLEDQERERATEVAQLYSSTVRVHNTRAKPNFAQPWRPYEALEGCYSTAVAVSGGSNGERWLLACAHVFVDDSADPSQAQVLRTGP